MTISEHLQLRAFARIDGAYLGILWTISFACYIMGMSQPTIGLIGTATALEILFVIVFATFVAYFLIPLGQKMIRPTLVSLYSYLQPMIACAVSIAIGMDSLNLIKLLSIVLVFGGVALVSRSRAAAGGEKK